MPRTVRSDVSEPATALGRGRTVTHAGLGLLVALTAGACHRPSPWTSYVPDDSQHQHQFVTLTKKLTFIPGAPQHKPFYNMSSVDVAIEPEMTVDHFNVGKQQYGDTHFQTDSGRVLAKLALQDPNADYPPLKLTQATKDNYVIWWVGTGGKPDTSAWTNHYYLVDASAGSVKEIVPDTTQPPRRFVWVEEQRPIESLPLGDWNVHDDIWGKVPGPAVPDSIHSIARTINSTWVSCGSGCCNGR
jgi:hypothetical protein